MKRIMSIDNGIEGYDLGYKITAVKENNKIKILSCDYMNPYPKGHKLAGKEKLYVFDDFEVGDVVTIHHEDFEYKQQNVRTGEFAKGKIVKFYNDKKALVETFTKDRDGSFRYKIELKYLIKE